MSTLLAIPTTFSGRKPLGLPVQVRADLRAAARSVYVLRDGQAEAVDELGNSSLALGASTAKPIWGVGVNGGQGLVFDGSNDECWAATGVNIQAPAWVSVAVQLGSNTSSQQCLAGLGSAAAASGAFLYIYIQSGILNAQVRWLDGGTAITITGPSVVANGVYDCSLLSRGQADHVLWVNGVRYPSTASTLAAGTSLVNMAIGHQRRGASSIFALCTIHAAAYGLVDPGETLLRDWSVDPYSMIYAQSQFDFTLWRHAAASFIPAWAAQNGSVICPGGMGRA